MSNSSNNTPIFDQLVAEFLERKNVRVESLFIPTRIKGESMRGNRSALYVCDEANVIPPMPTTPPKPVFRVEPLASKNLVSLTKE